MGARRVLMRIVVWWSFFTAATGLAWNFTSIVITRLLFGVGEAGCFPNLTKSFTTWLPSEGAGKRARHLVDERPLGRRIHAAAGGRGS